MFIELHILQNFAPSNLNRDESGSPKSCKFGDFPRARVSSQSLKRAARTFVEKQELLDPKTLGIRSLLLKDELKDLLAKAGKDRSQADYVAKSAFSAAQWQGKDDDKSGYLQFLGTQTLEEIKKLCLDEWDVFTDALALLPQKEQLSDEIKNYKKEVAKLKKQVVKNPNIQHQLDEADKKQKGAEEKVKQVDEQIASAEKKQNEVAKKIKVQLGKKHTPDVAMFGRMITTAPLHSIDAASQVAHAISTHAVWSGDFDYFTAIDELKKKHAPESDAGAAMIGTTEFNSACYYRYANVDVAQLTKNLEHAEDIALVEKTVKAFLKSFVIAVPSGKQNSFASPTLPTFVMAVIRDYYLCSLANAFAKPIRLTDEDESGLVEKSISKLMKHFYNLERMYGKTVGTKFAVFYTESPESIVKPNENDGKTFVPESKEVDSLEDLIDEVIAQGFSKA